MPASTVMVVYDATVGHILWMVNRNGQTENDDYSAHKVPPGCASLFIPVLATTSQAAIQVLVNQQTGLSPKIRKFVVLDLTATVVDIVQAYSQPIARLPNTVVETADPNAFLGATFLAGVFTPPPSFFAAPLPIWPPISLVQMPV